MDDRPAKRDLVLAPSEYAYMQDVTKGIIKTYTGPTVINPTAQERPVSFNQKAKRFDPCNLEEAVQNIAIAPEGYYLVLKNPSQRNDHPAAGGVQPSPDLEVGRKINITGPCAFALWPGQIVKLIQGHHLRSNQYLLVRVYNEEEARKNWAMAVIKPATEGAGETPVARTPEDLTVGKLLLIKGTDVSFYIPPTGVGVVTDEGGAYVRDALTLERLEYCILVDENGKKRYERGPQVVFPQPTETFIRHEEHRKFRAVELNEIQGLHIKVIAPYEEAGRAYKEGDELFITGSETAIYYPREEHSLVRYDGREKHFAVAVPAGEARYVMNRKTGAIHMAVGPAMLLPNPVDEILVRRVLTERECLTWYPGNEEALTYNRSLRSLTATAGRAGIVAEGDYQRSQQPMARAAAPAPAASAASGPGAARERAAASGQMGGDIVDRASQFNQPRTLVFNTKYDGVPSMSVWVGYAVMVIDKRGNRRVEVGPKNLLLNYDETLEIVELSTSKPKSTVNLLHTVFLRVLNNKVSDICEVETSDHVRVKLEYSMRVNFEGEPQRWFEVENYVKFLCDHVRSVLKGHVKRIAVDTFYAQSVDIVRDVILGKAQEAGETGGRVGMRFKENGMHITDVEVLNVTIDDANIAVLLNQAQHEAVASNIGLMRANRALEVTQREEEIQRMTVEAKAETARHVSNLEVGQIAARLAPVLAQFEGEMKQHQELKKLAVARVDAGNVDHQANLDREKATATQRLEIETAEQALRLAALKAEVDATVSRFAAAQGGFSEALLALSSHEVLVKVAEAMSVQQFVGGKNLTDVIDRVFAGTPLAGLMDRIKGGRSISAEAEDEA